MSLETTMQSGGVGPAGSGGMAKGGELETPFQSYPCPVPSYTESSDTYDRNTAPAFSQPRASGGLPVEFFENVPGSPGTLESTLEDTNDIARKAYVAG